MDAKKDYNRALKSACEANFGKEKPEGKKAVEDFSPEETHAYLKGAWLFIGLSLFYALCTLVLHAV